MMAVASFTRLSPSITAMMRVGRCSRFRIAVTATASGGETIAPRMNAAAHGTPGTIACSTTATATVVKITRPTASMPIGRRWARKSCQRSNKAAR